MNLQEAIAYRQWDENLIEFLEDCEIYDFLDWCDSLTPETRLLFFGHIHFNDGVIAERVGRKDVLLELDIIYPNMIDTLGWTYRQMRDFVDPIEHFRMPQHRVELKRQQIKEFQEQWKQRKKKPATEASQDDLGSPSNTLNDV